MTDLTKGKKFDRISMTWLEPEEYERRYAEWEERAFQRGSNQGELCCPMIIRDGMDAVQSQTNGKFYDSKSAIRKEYKRAGVIEVGNDVQTEKAKPTYMEKEANAKKRRASVGRALSRMGFGAP